MIRNDGHCAGKVRGPRVLKIRRAILILGLLKKQTNFAMKIERLPITIAADPARVVLRYLDLQQPEHLQAVLHRFIQLSRSEIESLWREVNGFFAPRHRNYQEQLLRMARHLEMQAGWRLHFDEEKRMLLGALVTKEYALEAAGVFNPSIVPHPDQEGAPPGVLRFILSLRAVGEGHYSSLTFREGRLDAAGEIMLEPYGRRRTTARRDGRSLSHDFLRSRLFYWQNFDPGVIKLLPDPFALEDVFALEDSPFREVVLQIIDNNYSLIFPEEAPLTERVILPLAASEAHGMEDVRLVRAHIDGIPAYLGAYTAYDGVRTQTKLLATDDFRQFKVRSFYGHAAKAKGMVLFPRKIRGRYTMVAGGGNKGLHVMYSEDVLFWETSYALPELTLPWALLGLGVCGAPIETEAGWLLLINGIGPMYQHSLGVVLLDRERPEKLIACLPEPLLTLRDGERVGYEPNRLYSCGWILHRGNLFIPYSMADVSCSFARIDRDELLAALLAERNQPK